MVDFWVYDVAFMILFSVGVAWFLSTRKKDLSREGLMFLYRTQAGIKFINYVGDTYKKTLSRLRYVIIGVGLVLMASMIWMLGQTLWIYIKFPGITDIIKAPPIAPLIPYFPKLFGMESFFPPFYFTYFIVALAIVAVVHEGSHGIFMRRFKVPIKSTGLVFLGPILGAFVEEEKRGFEKKKTVEQMTILGAGVFANLVFAMIFYLLYVAFFFSSFAASGYIFTSYAYVSTPIDSIDSFGRDIGEREIIINGGTTIMNFTEVIVGEETYLMSTNNRRLILEGTDFTGQNVLLFPQNPAIKTGLKGIIVEIDDQKIRNHYSLSSFLNTKKPGDLVTIITENENGRSNYEIVLAEHPDDSNRAYIGIAHTNPQRRGFIGKLISLFMGFKESSTYYQPTWDGELVEFIFYLLWWVMVINLLVALFNMMPLGMLDGGRFFYLSVLSVTGSSKFASMAFKFATYAIIFVFAFLMFIWAVRVF
ncbi:MAG: site-2 protease family protein [Nanoarchaeota archaeon]|nr:site-2 protease family protein [Nanoarchaeota archaeon]